MAAPDPRTHTDAILTQLATSGLEIGDAVRPTDQTRPYLVLYPLTPSLIEGPSNDSLADQFLDYQVTCVGDTREQAEWAQQQARSVMLPQQVTPPTGRAWLVDFELTPAAAVERDDDVQPPVFYTVDIYRLATTPTTAVLTFPNLGVSATPDFGDTANVTTYASPSWTPPTSGIIVAWVVAREGTATTATTPTMSGNGLTWTQLGTTVDFTTGFGISLFAAFAAGATTGATTVDFGATAQGGCVAAFNQIVGADETGSISDAFIIANFKTASATTDSLSITLDPAAADANRPIAGFGHAAAAFGDPRTGWTELDDLATVPAPALSVETQYRDDMFETTASVTWSQSVRSGGIAIEVKAAT